MFKTKTLGSLKSFLPSIHQPLPLSRRESQKLLDILKTSFRDNLDREHGFAPAPTAPTPRHARPTDRHLHAILSNPLFSQGRSPTPEKLVARPGPQADALPGRDPTEFFDRAAARGIMTLQAAKGCLHAQRVQILQSSAVSVQEELAATGLGFRVVQWLQASGQESSFEFLTDGHLCAELIPFLLAEGLEEVAWSWVDRLMAGAGPEKRYDLAGMLIRRIVVEKTRQANLDPALATILRADDMFGKSPGFTTSMTAAWQKMADILTLDAWRQAPSVALFDAFVGTASHLRKPPTVALSHLDLHHPTTPSPARALQFFKSKDVLEGMKAKFSFRGNIRVAVIGLDLVKHLIGTGRASEADRILDLLRSDFSIELRAFLLTSGNGHLLDSQRVS